MPQIRNPNVGLFRSSLIPVILSGGRREREWRPQDEFNAGTLRQFNVPLIFQPTEKSDIGTAHGTSGCPRESPSVCGIPAFGPHLSHFPQIQPASSIARASWHSCGNFYSWSIRQGANDEHHASQFRYSLTIRTDRSCCACGHRHRGRLRNRFLTPVLSLAEVISNTRFAARRPHLVGISQEQQHGSRDSRQGSPI